MRDWKHGIPLVMVLFTCVMMTGFSVASADEGIASGWTSPGNSLLLLENDERGVHLQFTGSTVEMSSRREKGEDYVELKIPGIVAAGEAGRPYLPDVGALIAMPLNGRLEISVHSETWTTHRDILVWPWQEKPSRCGDGTGLPFTCDEETYRTDRLIAKPTATLEEIGQLRDIRVGRLSIHPFRYNAARRELHVLQSCDVSVRYIAQGDPVFITPHTTLSPSFQQLYRASFLNSPLLDRVGSDSRASGESMLVLIDDTLVTETQPFIDWKRKKGITVVSRVMSSVGNSVASIKAAIQEAYDTYTPRPSYVLLVGNETTIVPDRRSTSGGSQTASDYPYTLLSGGDILPDILLGRIVANNGSDVTIQVAKIVSYEQNPHLGGEGAWYPRASGIASNEGSNPSDEDYIIMIENALLGNTYNSMDRFFQSLGNATATNINNAISAGRSWFTYIGHGSGTGWGSTNGSYTNTSIDSQTNGYKMTVLVDVACNNGEFDKSWECFGEAWMRKGTVASPKGAVGYYGGSVSISWDPPAVMSVGCAIRHFSTPVTTWGATCLVGQLYLVEQMGTGSSVVDNFEWYILFGDPSMVMRTSVPLNLNVQGNPILYLGQTSYAVTVLNASSQGVPGVLVSCRSQDQANVFGVATTNANGQATITFDVPPTLPGTMLVTATGYNTSTVTNTITVAPSSGPYVVIKNVALDDSQLGNNNQQADFGETVHLSISLENVGIQAATDVTATLSTLDQYLQIVDGTETYGTIQPSQIVPILRGFRMTVSPLVPNGYSFPLTLTMTSTNKAQWQQNFSITAHSPQPVYVQTVVNEVSGNFDGFFDPGEYVNLVVDLKNNGGADLRGVTATLTTSDSYVTIINGQSPLADLMAGGQNESATFFVSSSSATPSGHAAVFHVVLTTANGYSSQVTFSVQIGSINAYIWDPMSSSPTTARLAQYFSTNNLSFEQGTTLPADLGRYRSFYALLGIYSSNHVLTSTEGTQLATYLDNGGNLYMEGGDTWAYNTATAVHPYFAITGLSDGSGDTGTIRGVTGTFSEGLEMTYSGRNSYMDRLSAAPGGYVVFNNVSPAYSNGIARDAGTYRTIGTSFDLGSCTVTGGNADAHIAAIDQFLTNRTETQQVPALGLPAGVILLLLLSITIPAVIRRR